jgi:hypothetical protein
VLEREGGWYAVIELPETADEESFCVRLLEGTACWCIGFFFD